jgi:hypothetical protein
VARLDVNFTGAGNWPDDIGHNVIIDASGIGGPIIQSGDSIKVRHIFHSAKNLTIQNNGILNIVGNYSYNQPNLTAAGIGRLIQSGFSITGTNGSQFTTQLNRGSLLFTTEGGFIGEVQSIASNSSITLALIGGGTPVNIPDSSTYNIIVPTISAGAGNLSSSNTSRVVTGTGFTSNLRKGHLSGRKQFDRICFHRTKSDQFAIGEQCYCKCNKSTLFRFFCHRSGWNGHNKLPNRK